MEINQSKSDFEKWLRSLPDDEFAIAADCTKDWVCKWLNHQGIQPYAVHSIEIGFISLFDPYQDDFDPITDRVPLEEWAIVFLDLIDDYFVYGQTTHVTKAQAIAALKSIDQMIEVAIA